MSNKTIKGLKKEDFTKLVNEVLPKINKINDFIQKHGDSIVELSEEIEDVIENIKQANQAKDGAEKLQIEISEIKKDAVDSQGIITDFYNRIYSKQEISEENPEGLSIEKQFEKLKEDKNEELENLNKGWNEKFVNLNTRIEELLPRATSAGLAGSFKDAKDEVITKKVLGFLWGGLIASLIGVTLIGLYVAIDLGPLNPTDEIKFLSLVVKFSYSFPLIWLAWFFHKNISDAKKLKEEYHNKERIMRTYDGMMKQIKTHNKRVGQDEEGEEVDLENKLTNIMLNAMADNPAKNLGETKGHFLTDVFEVLKLKYRDKNTTDQ